MQRCANPLFTFIALASLMSCSHTVLTTPLISMTKDDMPSASKPNKIGKVRAEWCRGDADRDGGLGLVDEVTLKAQEKSGADYIEHAVFIRSGNCMTIVGTGLRLGKGKKR